jgi:hypothetical protein
VGRHSGLVNTLESFVKACLIRFGPTAYDDPMEALTHLRQTTIVAAYKAQFKGLSNRLRGLSEQYKLNYFLSGLKDEVRLPICMLNPSNLIQAFGLAKIQEEYVTSSRRISKQFGNSFSPYSKPAAYGQQSFSGEHSFSKKDEQGKRNPNGFPIQRASTTHMKERRSKGLCYTCDEKWNPSHVCKTPRLYLMQGIGANKGEHFEEVYFDSKEGEGGEEASLENSKHPEISLHAISGSSSPNTMRLEGTIRLQRVIILVDLGSTHNFVDPYIVRKTKLQCLVEEIIIVKVANGEVITSEGKCSVVAMKIQGNIFSTEFYFLTLGGCDIVLGVQWLRTLGLIIWDFLKLTMACTWLGTSILLQGLKPTDWTMEKRPKFFRSSNKGVVLQLIECENKPPNLPVSTQFEGLLNEFKGVFEKPRGLPPIRSHDHRIVLKEGSKPVCIQCYRYPYYQKTEIEKIFQDLLESGVIRSSQSLFSSPVLLVSKVDGSWRMCMDYRALNQETIKDKFLIPVIDELLDELFGANFFF